MSMVVPKKAENPKIRKEWIVREKFSELELKNTTSREIRETVRKKEAPRNPRKIRKDIGKFGR